MADPLVIDESVPRAEVRAILTRGRGRITAATLDEFPSLVVVGRCGAGLDNIDVGAARERGIAVVNASRGDDGGGRRACRVADARSGPADHHPRRRSEGGQLDGSRQLPRCGSTRQAPRRRRVGVDRPPSGCSRPGVRDGRRLSGARPPGTTMSCDSISTSCSRTSDIVQLCVALTAETRQLLDRTRLAAMRSTALLVNTARGALVDHEALIEAITSGRLGGYATDVWEPEPPPLADLEALGRPPLSSPPTSRRSPT